MQNQMPKNDPQIQGRAGIFGENPTATGTEQTLTVGIDVGGTKIGAGLVDAAGNILSRTRFATPAGSVEKTAQTIAEAINELANSRSDVSAVGIGAAGFTSADRATVSFAANLAWREEPLAQRVQALCGLPVVVENDANVVAWAESRFGAGRGAKSVVALTIGTGVGAGIVYDGRLLRGFNGFAAEVGHMKLEKEGRLCGCGQRGCWEQYASGSALVADARRLVEADRRGGAAVLELAGGSVENITGLHVSRAAQAGDPFAIGVFNQLGYAIAYGMADLAAVLDPEIFVIGGGVAEAGELLLNPIEEALDKYLTARKFRELPKIAFATMGQGAGIVGAADLARY